MPLDDASSSHHDTLWSKQDSPEFHYDWSYSPEEWSARPGSPLPHHLLDNTALPPSSTSDHTSQEIPGVGPLHAEELEPESSSRASSQKSKKRGGKGCRLARWEGFEWQKHFTRPKQELIYRRIRAHWGPYDKLRYRKAFKSLRKMMDVSIAQKILRNDRTTIENVARATYNGERARQTAIRERGTRAVAQQRWPDPKLALQEKKKIMKNLMTHWKETGATIRGRLKSHYEHRLAPALIDKKSESFSAAADYLYGKTRAGRYSGDRGKIP